MPRRCSSTVARSPKVALSVKREKYDSAVVCTPSCPSLFVPRNGSPTARVRASAHCPCTSGTIAPSTLSTSWSGPRGGRGWVWRMRSAAAVWSATAVAPAASVMQAAVVRWTSTCVQKANSVAALANEGMWVLKRTSPSCKRGVSSPFSKPNSSSRGEKPTPAGGADTIAAFEGEFLAAVGQEGPGMRAAFVEWGAALWTGGGLEAGGVLPGSGGTLERQVFEHARPRTCEPRIQLRFNLAQRRFRVLHA